MAGAALVQFGGDRNGTLKRYRTLMLDRQWISSKEVHGFTRVCAPAHEKWNAGGVYGSESLQSQRLEDVWAWEKLLLSLLLEIKLICWYYQTLCSTGESRMIASVKWRSCSLLLLEVDAVILDCCCWRNDLSVFNLCFVRLTSRTSRDFWSLLARDGMYRGCTIATI